jgi:hypothetical protein
MMAGRAHQAEGDFAGAGGLQRQPRGHGLRVSLILAGVSPSKSVDAAGESSGMGRATG